MSKKFSIVKTLDIDKLNHEIYNYINNTGEEKPYIFMNVNTFEAVAGELISEIKFRPCEKLDGYLVQYDGYKVFANEDLTFGEVEIR